MKNHPKYLLLMALSAISSLLIAQPEIKVVNVVPESLSEETYQNSEPSIAHNPHNPKEIVVTAFVKDPNGHTDRAPVYLSTDGGNSWVMHNILPVQDGNGKFGDVTVGFSKDNLYAAILGLNISASLLRSNAYRSPGLMTSIYEIVPRLDQPRLSVHTPMAGTFKRKDLAYVGGQYAGGQAELFQFLDVTESPERISPDSQVSKPGGKYGTPTAIHPDGTVYILFYTYQSLPRDTNGNEIQNGRKGDMVIVSDQNWGLGSYPYPVNQADDDIKGVRVASDITWWDNSGRVFGEVRVQDWPAIAVDPNDSRTVYVAWGDDTVMEADKYNVNLHVRKSTDGGQTWSGDLLFIPGAVNPELAVNTKGDVGFLYQQLTGDEPNQRWRSEYKQSTDGGVNWTTHFLADVSANIPTPTGSVYLGEYAGLTAVGKDFYGVFSSSNQPKVLNFPTDVNFQRRVSFTSEQLLDREGNEVDVSIDPFFFHVQNLSEDKDYFVRDWTEGINDYDAGLEPSTNPQFFVHSDVWNRRSDMPPLATPVNLLAMFNGRNQPKSELPRAAGLGDNYAFARVHRKATGSSATVKLQFLHADFGLGSNYQPAGTSPDPELNFAENNRAKTMTRGYRWALPDNSSSHQCMAVQINTSEDPHATPGLAGRVPGWPETDLLVINDNNKAQRNFVMHSGSGGGKSRTYWAIIHNGATYTRDQVLEWDAGQRFMKWFENIEVNVVGGGKFKLEDNRITLMNMAPGENRWISLTLPVVAEQLLGETLSVNFYELRGEQAVNGFSIGMQRTSLSVACQESLELFAVNLYRIYTILGITGSKKIADALGKIVREGKVEPEEYVQWIRKYHKPYRGWIQEILAKEATDHFTLSRKLKELEACLATDDIRGIEAKQSNTDHALDAFLSYLDKQNGDVADVAQNMRWQHRLLTENPSLQELNGIDELIKSSRQFDLGYATGKYTIADYAKVLEGSLSTWYELNKHLGLGMEQLIGQIESKLKQGNPQELQKLHHEFLLRLDRL